MKTLLLLRHAKSGGRNAGLPDHDRPLNARGRRDAPRIGALLRAEGLLPDVVLCSTARRARDTAEAAIEAGDLEASCELYETLYMAEPDEMLSLLRGLPDGLRSAMLVGHNPGMEELLAALTGFDEPFPTAALAEITLEIDRWAALRSGVRARLERIVRPRELA